MSLTPQTERNGVPDQALAYYTVRADLPESMGNLSDQIHVPAVWVTTIKANVTPADAQYRAIQTANTMRAENPGCLFM